MKTRNSHKSSEIHRHRHLSFPIIFQAVHSALCVAASVMSCLLPTVQLFLVIKYFSNSGGQHDILITERKKTFNHSKIDSAMFRNKQRVIILMSEKIN